MEDLDGEHVKKILNTSDAIKTINPQNITIQNNTVNININMLNNLIHRHCIELYKQLKSIGYNLYINHDEPIYIDESEISSPYIISNERMNNCYICNKTFEIREKRTKKENKLITSTDCRYMCGSGKGKDHKPLLRILSFEDYLSFQLGIDELPRYYYKDKEKIPNGLGIYMWYYDECVFKTLFPILNYIGQAQSHKEGRESNGLHYRVVGHHWDGTRGHSQNNLSVLDFFMSSGLNLNDLNYSDKNELAKLITQKYMFVKFIEAEKNNVTSLEKKCKAHLLANQDLWSHKSYKSYFEEIEKNIIQGSKGII